VKPELKKTGEGHCGWLATCAAEGGWRVAGPEPDWVKCSSPATLQAGPIA